MLQYSSSNGSYWGSNKLHQVFFDVPFLIRCNSTTNPAVDAGIIALERSCSVISNDIWYVSILVLKRKLTGLNKSYHGLALIGNLQCTIFDSL
jgi:hypothetical protein